jgi:hypothetical protein
VKVSNAPPNYMVEGITITGTGVAVHKIGMDIEED